MTDGITFKSPIFPSIDVLQVLRSCKDTSDAVIKCSSVSLKNRYGAYSQVVSKVICDSQNLFFFSSIFLISLDGYTISAIKPP